MTRGNQREQDRLKAQKKAASSQKAPKESAASLAKRKEADAEALRAKQKPKRRKQLHHLLVGPSDSLIRRFQSYALFGFLGSAMFVSLSIQVIEPPFSTGPLSRYIQ
ncbi:hypothetical protein CPB83DRAFT_267547 [Crepidotus variabilis]|uniref:Small EDRK-rich factor-like N-terminal domain-containing protein n=1 Tax=Crepidotus variabilis TaxID=179855 RepID=A0A9P6JQQ7_9AGAR|nr:hypothetical protein CPB83DRAFT_267547 [Crepidotus variabilis]